MPWASSAGHLPGQLYLKLAQGGREPCGTSPAAPLCSQRWMMALVWSTAHVCSWCMVLHACSLDMPNTCIGRGAAARCQWDILVFMVQTSVQASWGVCAVPKGVHRSQATHRVCVRSLAQLSPAWRVLQHHACCGGVRCVIASSERLAACAQGRVCRALQQGMPRCSASTFTCTCMRRSTWVQGSVACARAAQRTGASAVRHTVSWQPFVCRSSCTKPPPPGYSTAEHGQQERGLDRIHELGAGTVVGLCSVSCCMPALVGGHQCLTDLAAQCSVQPVTGCRCYATC